MRKISCGTTTTLQSVPWIAETDSAALFLNDNRTSATANEQIDETTDGENEDADEIGENEPNSVENNDHLMEFEESNSIENNHDLMEDDEPNPIENADDSLIDGVAEAKHILPTVQMSAVDELAIAQLIGECSQNASTLDEEASPLDSISLGTNETASLNSAGEVVVKKMIGEGLEMCYIHGQKPTPKNPFYQTKINDDITGNIPFKENVGKDRAYLVKIGGRFHEVKMCSKLVDTLRILNETDNRKNAGFDMPFVKGLLIGFCTANSIQKRESIHKDLLVFIKGEIERSFMNVSILNTNLCMFSRNIQYPD